MTAVAVSAQLGGTERVLLDLATHAAHCESGLAAIPYGSQAGGYFTKLAADPTSVAKSGFHNDANRALLPALQGAATDLGTTITAIALAWLVAQPYVTIPIIGSRSIPQLEDSLRAATITLPDDLVARLNHATGL